MHQKKTLPHARARSDTHTHAIWRWSLKAAKGNEDLAGDLFQDVFVAALRAYSRFRGEKGCVPQERKWLKKVFHSTWCDFCRREYGRKRKVVADADIDLFPA